MTNEKRNEPYVCMLIPLVHTVEMYTEGDAAARWTWPVEVSGEGSRASGSCWHHSTFTQPESTPFVGSDVAEKFKTEAREK